MKGPDPSGDRVEFARQMTQFLASEGGQAMLRLYEERFQELLTTMSSPHTSVAQLDACRWRMVEILETVGQALNQPLQIRTWLNKRNKGGGLQPVA